MRLSKAVAVVLSLGLAVCLSGQDLATAAKKEKERREKLKGKSAVVVTNSDLAKIKKKAAVENPVQGETEGPPSPPDQENAPPTPAKKPTAVGAGPGKELRVGEEEADVESQRAELQAKVERAAEKVEFLTLKMRALQQQFFSFNTMQTKDKVQRDIAETNLKLQAAVAEQAALKKESEDFADKHPVKK